jgi:cell wall assembly regulator SMI1
MWWLPIDKALQRQRFVLDLGIDWPATLLPIAEDAGGNLLVADLGNGRISAWDHETASTQTIAPDFGSWMGALAEDMAAGRVAEDDGEALVLLETS